MNDLTYPAVPQVFDRVQLVDSYGNPLTAIPTTLTTGSDTWDEYSRLRTDPGHTGFFEGKVFRAFFNGTIPVAGPSVQFKFVSPVDFILHTQALTMTQGALRLEVFVGATESGTWTAVPVIGQNRMSNRPEPYYESQCSVFTGGNFTGGTRMDLMEVRAGQDNKVAANVGAGFEERGLPAATFYGRLSTLTGGLTVNDAAQYIYSLLWEEVT